MIKEAYLDSEFNNIETLLNQNDLTFDKFIDKTFYIEEDKIIATVSIYKNIIKCICVDESYKHSGYLEKLLSFVINYFNKNNIYHYLVYTKLEYEKVFESNGFKKIVATDKVIVLESGIKSLDKVLAETKNKIEKNLNINIENEQINCVVVNANPITNGHMYLIEKAMETSKYVLVFVVKEDLSYFSFKERYSYVYLACNMYKNVYVLSLDDYIVSTLSFPGYFLKEESEKNKQWAKVDSEIFKIIMDKLNINYRYIGKETKDYMITYNNVLKETLKEKIVEIDRLNNISASKIRTLLQNKQFDEALNDIPNSVKMLIRCRNYD